MSDATALLAAIRAAPKDDAPRLIFADWLDENGRPARAEFIRVQCALARKNSPALRRREAALLAAHYSTFAYPLATSGLLVRFYRGFAVGFGHTGFFVRTRTQDGRTMNDLLRFHPHRTVLGVSTFHAPAAAAAWVGRASPFTTVGTYTLDPFVLPTRVWFTCTSSEGSASFVGALEPPILTAYRRGDADRSPMWYLHLPILGFDTFTET
jgi:uncharacterized protein (TIGR02996 family)